MSPKIWRTIFLAPAMAGPCAALAQTEPPPVPAPTDQPGENDIVVTAPADRGDVIGRTAPDIRLDRGEIAAYGAGNVGELLRSLVPQTGRNPVVLINGRRASGPEEIGRLPPEAIERVDILPPEVALAYGYRADQRVVNIVLVRRFYAVTGELSARVPTAGGRREDRASVNLTRIDGSQRFGLDLDYGRQSALFESERGLAGRNRTLLPGAETLGLGASLSRTIFGDVAATVDARFNWRRSESGFGYASGPLVGVNDSRSGRVSLALNGRIAAWNWSLNAGYERSQARLLTDRGPDAAAPRDVVETRNAGADAELVASGALLRLPAGNVSATLLAGLAVRDQAGDALVGGVRQRSRLSNDTGRVRGNVAVPIASRESGVLAALGELSFNVGIGRERVARVGMASTFDYGMSWAPWRAVRLTASLLRARGLPPVGLRQEPLRETPNVPVYDFAAGETVFVTRVDGGNPALAPDDRRTLSLSGQLTPFRTTRFNFNFNYTNTHSLHPTGSVPAATAAVQAAFPDRFIRDGAGRLARIDARPINFARAEQEQISWGAFLSLPIAASGSPTTISDRSSSERGDSPAPGPGQLLLAFNHAWQLRDELVIRDGLAPIDQLQGATLGGRGPSRHQINAVANLTLNGLGASLEGSWLSGSRPAPAMTGLSFSALATLNVRLFADLGRMPGLTAGLSLLRGARMSLDVANLLDSRTRVRDAGGGMPLAYQPAYLDPLGRTLRFSLRMQL